MAWSSGVGLSLAHQVDSCRMARSSGASVSSAQLFDEWLHGAVKWCESELSAAGRRVVARRGQSVGV
jgi:hypothetical protein